MAAGKRLAAEYKHYLFNKGILVNDTGENRRDCVRALFTLADVFGIRITKDPHLATWAMVELAVHVIGQEVPQPFYRGFPNSVLELTEDQLLMDQLIHYAITYGLGDFSQPGHSLFEKEFERLAFREKTEPKDFIIIEAEEAMRLIADAVQDLLSSTRPLNGDQEDMVVTYARACPEKITVCRSKDTAIRLIDGTRDISFARFLKLPDVIRMADEINYSRGLGFKNMKENRDHDRRMAQYIAAERRNNQKKAAYRAALKAWQDETALYEARKKDAAEKKKTIWDLLFPRKEEPVPPPPAEPEEPVLEEAVFPAMIRYEKDIRHLDLRNRDRKLISAVIDYFFEQEETDISDCYEKKRAWCGLLHHIHYEPKNERASSFVMAMRTRGKNRSAYARFEEAVARGDIAGAAKTLAHDKGSGAVARHMDYLLSRAGSRADVDAVVRHLSDISLIMLYQLLLHYETAYSGERTFRFVQHRLLRTHEETRAEAARRKSSAVLFGPFVKQQLRECIGKKLADRKIGRVYIEKGMERITLPMQGSAGASGPGVLPRGSRIPVPEGHKVRCFTYWEKVDDIDLACFGLEEEGEDQIEFSWRSMSGMQSEAITFSGDETSGYDGGSEFFDIRIPEFREKYPSVRYIVFTDNVYTDDVVFSEVLCKAGFMIREEDDSGGIFEPRTVSTAFRISGKSTFSHLFALDLEEREMIWLNLDLDSDRSVAGTSDIGIMRHYFSLSSLINMRDLFAGMASQLADDPAQADLIVADHFEGPVRPEQTLIRSCDLDKVLAMMNK